MDNPESQKPDDAHSARAGWMGLLARADETRLSDLSKDIPDLPATYTIIRGPEEGLVMVRARAGGSGERFNMGEMTVTRCSVELANGFVGHAYVAGRRPEHAERAALIDALMLEGTRRSELLSSILRPLEEEEEKHKVDRSRKAAATRVDFFTVVRGED